MVLFLDKYTPERCGVCSGKKKAFTHTCKNTANYGEKFLELYEKYIDELNPFGVSLLTLEGDKVVGFAFDIDDHPSEPRTYEEALELAQEVKDICAPLPLGMECTEANNGIHLWCIFSQHVKKEIFLKFTDYVQARLSTDLEIYPSTNKKKNWIRLPGKHKDKTSWSYEHGKTNKLDNIEEIKDFFSRYTCSIELFEEYLKENKVCDFNLENNRKGSKKKKTSTTKSVSLRPEVLKDFISGIQPEHFEAIWMYVTGGKSCPNDDEQICCPFHDDSEPSARVYYDNATENRYFVCYSENCELNACSTSQSRGHDGYDLLSWKALGTFEKTKEHFSTVMEMFSDQIMAAYLKPYLMPKSGKGFSINYIKLTEAVSNYMYVGEGNDIDIRVGKDNRVYFYNSTTRIWETTSTVDEERSQIYLTVKNILQRLVGVCGLYKLNIQGIEKVSQTIGNYIYKQPKFEQKYLQQELIPCKNGLVDISKILEGKPEEALVPYKKKHYITTYINCIYNPEAKNEKFELFMNSSLPKKEIRHQVLEYLGSCLTPSISSQKCQFWVGDGRNGKGTLTSILREMFGKSYSSLELHNIAHPFKSAMLTNTFLNIDPDSIMGVLDQKNLAYLKKITGGDFIVAEEKYKAPFSFEYLGGFVACTNNVPKLGEVNNALLRRLVIIPFDTEFEYKNSIDKFWHTLIKDDTGYSGVLNILIEGLIRFVKRGKKFENIEECNKLIQQFAEESDPTMAYLSSLMETNLNVQYNEAANGLGNIEERVTHTQLEEGVNGTVLFNDFTIFCKQSNCKKAADSLGLNLKKFQRVLPKLISKSSYKDYIEIKRTSAGYIYIFHVVKAREELSIEM